VTAERAPGAAMTLVRKQGLRPGQLGRGTPPSRGTGLRSRKPLTRRVPLTAGAPLKRGKPLPRVSKKRAAQIRQRRAMLQAKYPGITLCEVPYCNRVADDPHEPLTRARGGPITDPANVKAVCRPHHDEITSGEPQWAYDLGFLAHSWDGAA
jgi:hypothetical protein